MTIFRIGDYVYTYGPEFKSRPYSVGQIERIQCDKVYCKWSEDVNYLPETIAQFERLHKNSSSLWSQMHTVMPLELKVVSTKIIPVATRINPLISLDIIALITKQVMDIDNYDSSTLTNLSSTGVDIDKIIQMVVPNVIEIIARMPKQKVDPFKI